MKCKFCRCTEDRPCAIPISYLSAKERAFFPSAFFPCSWLLPDVCSHPECVEKAYAEACAAVDRILLLEMAA